mgnify:CR=1 FL=1
MENINLIADVMGMTVIAAALLIGLGALGTAIGFAAVRATLETVLTPDNYAHAAGLGARLSDGIDRIVGGAGTDRVNGGAGTDEFVLTHRGIGNRDIIEDFNHADDTIALSNVK